ncbi:MAG: hypothetical protein ACREHE_00870 [Rhizomicrobium sp.]
MWIMIYGARITVSTPGGPKQDLGIARPELPSRFQQEEYERHATLELKVTLQPSQIMEIEEIRSAQNLYFELDLFAEGGGNTPGNQIVRVQEKLHAEVPRSDWIAQLRSVRALDVLLLEVPMPVENVPSEFQQIAKQLLQAQQMFTDGHFTECIFRCRAVMDALNKAVPPDPVVDLWQKLANAASRKQMTKKERETGIFALVRHYTHLAAHPGDNEPEQFSRGEARLLMSLSAALVAYAVKLSAQSSR